MDLSKKWLILKPFWGAKIAQNQRKIESGASYFCVATSNLFFIDFWCTFGVLWVSKTGPRDGTWRDVEAKIGRNLIFGGIFLLCLFFINSGRSRTLKNINFTIVKQRFSQNWPVEKLADFEAIWAAKIAKNRWKSKFDACGSPRPASLARQFLVLQIGLRIPC